MKTLLSCTFFAIIVLCVVGCKDDDSQPTQPNPNSTGNGVFKGNVRLLANWEQTVKKIPPIVWSDMSGTTITLANTALNALTDKDGNFILSGVDSGMHNIVISRIGYESVTVGQQYHNGKDTISMSILVKDTTGYVADGKYGFIYLFEQSINAKVKSLTATCKESIKIDTLYNHGTSKIIRDTTYDFISDIVFEAEHPFTFTAQNKPVGYYAKISDKSYVDITQLPADENLAVYKNKWAALGYWGNPEPEGVSITNRSYRIISSKSTNSNEYVLSSFKQHVQHSGKNLFLHVIPIWKANYRFIYNPISQEPPTYQYDSKLVYGDPVSIPIEWK